MTLKGVTEQETFSLTSDDYCGSCEPDYVDLTRHCTNVKFFSSSWLTSFNFVVWAESRFRTKLDKNNKLTVGKEDKIDIWHDIHVTASPLFWNISQIQRSLKDVPNNTWTLTVSTTPTMHVHKGHQFLWTSMWYHRCVLILSLYVIWEGLPVWYGRAIVEARPIY